MNKIIAWIKMNKLSTVLVVVIVLFILGNSNSPIILNQKTLNTFKAGRSVNDLAVNEMMVAPFGIGSTPRLDIIDRKVSTNSSLSLVVKDVREAINSFAAFASTTGGYMVNSSSTTPEGLSKGSVTIRVPSTKLDETLSYLREFSVKVVSESVTGRDITDQYMDVEARLNTLTSTKARYESILNQAVEVDEILNVTQQILYIQDQLDNLTGQLQYLDASANSSLVTIHLSTDEFELPYSPDQPWRPQLVAKYAVRGVVQTLRDIADLVIWIGVYAVFWVPALVIFFLIKKRAKSIKKK